MWNQSLFTAERFSASNLVEILFQVTIKHTAIFKLDNQQGPTVQHRELCSIFCNNLIGKRIWKRIHICICITESLCCTPETNTTLLINYTPIENKKLKKKRCIHSDENRVQQTGISLGNICKLQNGHLLSVMCIMFKSSQLFFFVYMTNHTFTQFLFIKVCVF